MESTNWNWTVYGCLQVCRSVEWHSAERRDGSLSDSHRSRRRHPVEEQNRGQGWNLHRRTQSTPSLLHRSQRQNDLHQTGSVFGISINNVTYMAQCALSLKRLSAGPGFNPQTRQNKLFQDYWRACFEINFSDRREGLTVSSIICDR